MLSKTLKENNGEGKLINGWCDGVVWCEEITQPPPPVQEHLKIDIPTHVTVRTVTIRDYNFPRNRYSE